MDTLPFVVDVYKRDLVVEHYAIGYRLHPVRVALHWTGMPVQMHVLSVAPQTVGGHRYRTRSGRARRGRDRPRDTPTSYRSGNISLMTTPSPTTCLGSKLWPDVLGKLGVTLVVQRQGECPVRHAEGC